MRLFQTFFRNRPDALDSPVPLVTLLAQALPRHDLQPLLAHLEVQPGQTEPVRLEMEQDWQTQDYLLAEVHFGAHTVQLAGFPTPLRPEAFQRAVATAAWGPEFRGHMSAQNAHVLLQYAGVSADPIQQYVALYRVAWALAATATHNAFLGLVNEPAWTSHPLHVLPDLFSPELLPHLVESPPLLFWTGVVKADDGNQRWFVTRGHHLFQLPDLAWPAARDADAMDVHERFADLFHYLYYENRDLQGGDFLYLEGHGYLAFEDEDALADALGGPAHVLTVRPSTEAEIAAIEAEAASGEAQA